MTAKPTSRQLQAQRTKQKIFDTALRLINTCGYDHVNVEQICKEAGISIGGFYHHFKNKDGIIVESFKQIDTFIEKMLPKIRELPNALDRIVYYLTLFGRYVANQGVDFTSQLMKSELSTEEKFTLNKERAIFTLLHDIVREGQEKGQLRPDIPAEKVTADLLRFARGIAIHWCISRGSYDLEQDLAQAARLYTIGLRPEHNSHQ
ncbi:MAG TPA: TetR/AcrR family transcriptional regulator [Clostridia bacterium]|nr:TetR/AcrR family transcriptional regulator [Clostridia bacterium]